MGNKSIVSAPKRWDNRWVWAAVQSRSISVGLPPHRVGALKKYLA